MNQTGFTQVHIRDATIDIQVRVIGARTIFGRTEYQVEPVTGSGSWWILAERLRDAVGEGGK